MSELKPFLKWAGGKRWLLQKYPNLKPDQFNRYIEPFLGGGAFYFSTQPSNAILSDLNGELIETYKAIRSDWESVLQILTYHHNHHCRNYYYNIRKYLPENFIERAARFIYLNRTCWNGLYRVNLKGHFNVPIGTKNNVLLDDNFKDISILLSNSTLITSDFEKTINIATSGDFVFVDPPYTIHHNTNGFLKYNQNLFAWDDQLRLRDAVVRARDRGAQVLVTNAAHDSVRELYREHGEIVELTRHSVISGKNGGRGPLGEILVRL